MQEITVHRLHRSMEAGQILRSADHLDSSLRPQAATRRWGGGASPYHEALLYAFDLIQYDISQKLLVVAERLVSRDVTKSLL